MGTSANRKGPKPSIPLLPDWMDEEPADENPNQQPEDSDYDEEPDGEGGEEAPNPTETPSANRFNQSQRGFQKAVKSGDTSGLKRVVKNYVSQGLGNTRKAAQRMSRSGGAIVTFGTVLGNIRQNGLAATLTHLQLGQYVGQPALQVLSALLVHVCGASALLDDAITKEAYKETVTRIIDESPDLDLENLTEAQTGEMLAIFLEESIVYRLICDIGRSQTVATSDPARAIEVEQEIYQIVNGMVHSSIVPELTKAMSDPANLNREIQRIYRVAFDAINNS
ncbi:Qat anti-phage system associated protein QatB [Salmonirosea aquatica]|uniref:Uncharacterized protein n=1 Tax=Salmonirosea aquatica TaxID=2654236 RepID=A0A7C9B9G0_9BACT|nr:hypothetical protein [Cytophagaceae bacterium SJW1-29]